MKTHIFLNQVGYLPDRCKIAAVVGGAKSFCVCAADTGKRVLEGQLSEEYPDTASGDLVRRADFSALTAPGAYYLQVGNKKSPPFSIGEDVYKPLNQSLLKFYYYNRCGTDLHHRHAGIYARKKCHGEKAVLFSDPHRLMDVQGGWHNGAEYSRPVYSGAVTVGFLLYAGLLYPESFRFTVNIPESGNGVPDLYNECRYELEWLLKMQDRDGGLYSKAETASAHRSARPSDDLGQVYVYGKTPDATAAFSAATALAARMYAPFDRDFSDKLLRAATRAWVWVLNYGEGHRQAGKPEETSRPQPGYEDVLFWASAEMYRLTGETGFRRNVCALYEKVDTACFTWNRVGGFGALCCLSFQPEDKVPPMDQEVCAALQAAFVYRADRLASMSRHSGYSTAKPGNHYLWGSNMDILGNAMTLIIAGRFSSEPDYDNIALEQLHYILGKNPMGVSYVTGFGFKSCLHPCHLLSTADGVEPPVPGLVVGGPDMARSDEYSKWLIPKGTPPAKCYVDREYCFSANEAGLCWNAPAVFVAGYFCRPGAQQEIRAVPQTEQPSLEAV